MLAPPLHTPVMQGVPLFAAPFRDLRLICASPSSQLQRNNKKAIIIYRGSERGGSGSRGKLYGGKSVPTLSHVKHR